MRRSWRFIDGVMVALLVGLAIVATRRVWADIFVLALKSEESSYILLAPAVAIWLAWLRRERIRFCRPQASPFGVIAIAIGWGLMAIGHERSIDLFRDFGAFTVVAGAVLVVTGPEIFIRFAASWGAALFIVPVPGRIRHVVALPLQQASAATTEFLLNLFAVSAERHGNVLAVNGVDVAIAEACNGMRMVAAMALIAYAFVFSFPMRSWARFLLLGISPLVALLVNVVRLVPTALFYGYSTPDKAKVFHDIAGWAVLLLAMGVMWCVLALLRFMELPVAPFDVREDE